MKKITKINCKSNYINSLKYDIQNKKKHLKYLRNYKEIKS